MVEKIKVNILVQDKSVYDTFHIRRNMNLRQNAWCPTYHDVRQELRQRTSRSGAFVDNYHFLREKGPGGNLVKIKRKTERTQYLSDENGNVNFSAGQECLSLTVAFFGDRRERYGHRKSHFARTRLENENENRPFSNRIVTYEDFPPGGHRKAHNMLKIIQHGRAHNRGKGVYHWRSRMIKDKDGHKVFKVFQCYKDFRKIAKRRSKQQNNMAMYPGIRSRIYISNKAAMANQKIIIEGGGGPGPGKGMGLPTNIIDGIYRMSLLRWGANDLNLLMRVERSWCEFIADRDSPSVQLRPMPQGLQPIFHQCSGYWRMHTESSNPEPGRYICFVKMR